eukprot:GFUD01045950.1.p1 GENE.GFUD01045950.1~~GFUD01045950.1.p1  ORF type:complete len:203 (+),score=43.20 GFUD01045950.1:13-621(+)
MGAKISRDRLSQEDLEFLNVNTHYTEDTISEWYKGFKKDCPEGKLTPDSFMKIYFVFYKVFYNCFTNENLAELCDHVFRTFDSDGNGFIDFKEFLLAMDVTSCGTPEEKLGLFFILFDVDGNGWIDLMEMKRLMRCIHTMVESNKSKIGLSETPEQQAKEIFKQMDVNSDGRVTKEEFLNACLVDQKLIELLTSHSEACFIQ